MVWNVEMPKDVEGLGNMGDEFRAIVQLEGGGE